MPKQRPTLHLAGPDAGPPTLEDILALAKALTGREPTSEEIEQARVILEVRKDA